MVAQDIRDEEAAPEASITLTVAVPIRLVEVPDLAGLTLSTANSALDEVGLLLGARTESAERRLRARPGHRSGRARG